MMSRPPKLAQDVRTHFVSRLKERYRVEMTLKECKELEKRKAGYFLHRETGTRSWYLMRISEQWVYCLFQKSLGFTTVLTPEQFWRSFPNAKLPIFRADSKFADAWTVARHDQKKHKPRNKVIVSRGRV